MKNISFLSILLFAFLFTQNNLYSQFSFQLAAQQEYNSNPFKSFIPQSSFISGYEFSAQYELNNLGVLYNGTLVNFGNNQDRNFYWNLWGVWVYFDSSAVSLSLEQRINRPLYSYYDYYELALNYEHQINLWGITTNIFPSLTYTSYKNISILDNFKSSLAFTLNKPFEWGTTIILGGSINHKIYTRPNKTDLIQAVNDSNVVENILIESQNASSITQLSVFARVAQSITPSTGLAVQYTNKNILSGMASSIKALNLTYGDESEIFDDPVNYEGNNFLVEITQIIFDDLKLKLGYYNNSKLYPSQGTYNGNLEYSLDLTRRDTQNIFSFSADKPFSLSENLGIDIGLRYSYIKNSSNSSLFRYSGSSFNLNIGFNF